MGGRFGCCAQESGRITVKSVSEGDEGRASWEGRSISKPYKHLNRGCKQIRDIIGDARRVYKQHPLVTSLTKFTMEHTVLSQDQDIDAPSHAVSEYEKTSYYNGITKVGEHPDLLYRTGSAKYPWIKPTGRIAHQPTKSLCGVHGTPLNPVWSIVGPQVSNLVRSVVNGYTINPVRFVTHGEDGEETLGPVVIWVCVGPGSTSADTAHQVSQKILELLKKNGVEDVEVEWHEGVTSML